MKKTIYFAAGCFWGTQAYFDLQKGVIETLVGYANGNSEKVTYQEVCAGKTNFVETCKVIFDDKIITFDQLLAKFWKIIDPTILNRQGNDYGSQYRTGIYYDKNSGDEIVKNIESSKNQIAKKYSKPIVTEILPLKNFVEAESVHQKYLENNPNGYCHINLNQ